MNHRKILEGTIIIIIFVVNNIIITVIEACLTKSISLLLEMMMEGHADKSTICSFKPDNEEEKKVHTRKITEALAK